MDVKAVSHCWWFYQYGWLETACLLCKEEETLDILSARDLLMEGSDPSDSDSTLMASIPRDPESTVSCYFLRFLWLSLSLCSGLL